VTVTFSNACTCMHTCLICYTALAHGASEQFTGGAREYKSALPKQSEGGSLTVDLTRHVDLTAWFCNLYSLIPPDYLTLM
jgi:hypothetical protein